ncbi:hypothetical protein ACFVDU_04310 [Streptomyces albidoflavus]
MSTKLFGPNDERTRIGEAEQEWAVWVIGPDDIHPAATLGAALEQAAELNATFAHLHLSSTSTSEYDPTMYAVVLHWGYAWTRSTEHMHGVSCGHPACDMCAADRTAALQCRHCGDYDGPFVGSDPAPTCERCHQGRK